MQDKAPGCQSEKSELPGPDPEGFIEKTIHYKNNPKNP